MLAALAWAAGASRRYLRLAIGAAALPFVAQAGGWLLREGGRQPWIVDGLLRTGDANSSNIGVWAVALSLAGVPDVLRASRSGSPGGRLARELGHGAEPDVEARSVPAGRDLALTY